MKKQLNLHLISDSTGETITFIAKAIISQFDDVETHEFPHFLIKTKSQMEKVVEEIKQNTGIILYTISNEEVENILNEICGKDGVLCIPAISPIVKKFENFLETKVTKSPGKQHEISAEYYEKMEAINYTLIHDDGNLSEDLSKADIVILGVSRSSKSPTSVYLAYKGYKVANVPFIKAELMPRNLKSLKKPLIVGFTIDAERLKGIRKSRVKVLDFKEETDYTDIKQIQEEVREAKKFFASLDIPVINVTEKSIEETSVYIINLLAEHKARM